MLSHCLAGMTIGGHRCNSFVVRQFLNSITHAAILVVSCLNAGPSPRVTLVDY